MPIISVDFNFSTQDEIDASVAQLADVNSRRAEEGLPALTARQYLTGLADGLIKSWTKSWIDANDKTPELLRKYRNATPEERQQIRAILDDVDGNGGGR